MSFSDATSGVDVATVALLLDGQSVIDACAFAETSASCTSPPLASGPHLLAVSLRDRAGNAAAVERSFALTVDLDAPVIAIVSPADGALVNAPSRSSPGR